MKPAIFRRPLAEEDLINIWLYTYENWSEEQANHYLDTLESAFKLIAENPLICRERDELTPPVRIHPCEQHLIIYIKIDSGIDIIRILHKTMDIDVQLSD